MNQPEIQISKLLIKKGKTIAVAESCTGGLLANILTNIPGSSKYFLLGVIVYSNKTKTSLLNISNRTLTKYGAVSYEVAQLMAKNIRKIACSDYGIGITGIAGPAGETKNKPVGTVFIAASDPDKVISKRFHFTGNRLMVKRKAALKALSILKKLF